MGATQAAAALAIHTRRPPAHADAVIVSPEPQAVDGDRHPRPGRPGAPRRPARAGLRVDARGSPTAPASCPSRAPRAACAAGPRALLVIDEAAYIEDATFTAARALVATGGRLVVQSTPADEYGPFHELVMADDPDWARFTVRSDEVPTISAAFLEAERRAMSPDAFAAEYECQFAKAGASLFTAERLAGLILPEERHETPSASSSRIVARPSSASSAARTTSCSSRASSACRSTSPPSPIASVRSTDPEARHVIDAEGLGSALWAVLGRPDDTDHWQLYTGRGLERQALVDELLVAVQEGRFHFAAGLEEQEAMSKALLGYRRQVREDGLIGSELVVALLLALIPPPPVFVPMFAFR